MLGRKMTWWSGLLGVSTSCQLGPEAAVRGAAGEGAGVCGASQSCTSGSSGDLPRQCRGRSVRLSARQNWSFLFVFFFCPTGVKIPVQEGILVCPLVEQW